MSDILSRKFRFIVCFLQESDLFLLGYVFEMFFMVCRYAQEGIDVDYEDVEYDDDGIGSPQALVSLLDRGNSQSATMLRTSQSDLSSSRQTERKGLLWLLDEEAVCQGGNDETFLDRLFLHYSDRGYFQNSIFDVYPFLSQN